jgi:hypothetical protein
MATPSPRGSPQTVSEHRKTSTTAHQDHHRGLEGGIQSTAAWPTAGTAMLPGNRQSGAPPRLGPTAGTTEVPSNQRRGRHCACPLPKPSRRPAWARAGLMVELQRQRCLLRGEYAHLPSTPRRAHRRALRRLAVGQPPKTAPPPLEPVHRHRARERAAPLPSPPGLRPTGPPVAAEAKATGGERPAAGEPPVSPRVRRRGCGD